jgi:hypothetical protein
MMLQRSELFWLDARESVSAGELARLCGLALEELDELVAYGALAPLPSGRPEALFSAEYVAPLRAAGKLRADFDLDLFTLTIVLDYLNRIEALEGELRSLKARLPGAG